MKCPNCGKTMQPPTVLVLEKGAFRPDLPEPLVCEDCTVVGFRRTV